jgi:hypothetical protein
MLPPMQSSFRNSANPLIAKVHQLFNHVLEELMETFRRYVPKPALERLKAEVAERRELLDETKVREEKPPQEGTEGCTGAGDGRMVKELGR